MRSLYAESDYANTIEYAEKMGEARGEARGIAIGEERGIAKREAQIVTAMLEKGMCSDRHRVGRRIRGRGRRIR